MAITDRARKTLWGRSGGRCAICRSPLIRAGDCPDGDSVVGVECHIHSPRANGPRHDPDLPRDVLDAYDNLVLLSPDCHKVIDDHPGEYPADRLRTIKAGHERWAATCLSLDTPGSGDADRGGGQTLVLPRISAGTQLLSLLAGSGVYQVGSDDEPESSEEAELVADFLQDVENLAIISCELEAGDIVREGFRLGQVIGELTNCGWLVFGASTPWRLALPDGPFSTVLATVRVVRVGNPAIIVTSPD